MSASAIPVAARSARKPPERFHRPELDQLRFGAFFLVFLHHALPHASAEYEGLPRVTAQAFAAIGRAGGLGVDLFFALSAYLITELLLREHRATGTVNVRAFYTRRVLRIWPLYFFALFALAPLMRFANPADTLPLAYAGAFALLSGNWMCAISGYPASSFALLWSVSIEEQFYLAWPWLMRRRARIATCALAMLAIASVTRIALAITGATHPAVWANTLARLDPIAGGALLAWWMRGRPGKGSLRWLGAGALTLAAIGGFGERDGWGALLSYPAAALASVAILYGSLGMRTHSSVLCYLGKISFGLYVFHVAAIEVAGSAIAGFALTVACAALSYRFLETPFLRLKERFALVGSRPV